MIGEITLNGKSSKDFQVYLTDAGIYGMPERDADTVQIEGKSGDLIIDNGRYKNKSTTFPCIIVDNFTENFSAFIGYILNQKGYIRIENSFKPDEFILGRYTGELEPKITMYAEKGKFELQFDRKPQRYIKEGEFPIEYTSSGSIYNAYTGTALPLVRVYGTGTLTIGSISIVINSVDTYVDIDCELQDAYKGTTNCNGNITLSNDKFFELASGINNFTIGNGISKIEIIPRWWRL